MPTDESVAWYWTFEHQSAFEEMKSVLSKAQALVFVDEAERVRSSRMLLKMLWELHYFKMVGPSRYQQQN